jgi:hypothetical protein
MRAQDTEAPPDQATEQARSVADALLAQRWRHLEEYNHAANQAIHWAWIAGALLFFGLLGAIPVTVALVTAREISPWLALLTGGLVAAALVFGSVSHAWSKVAGRARAAYDASEVSDAGADHG